MGKNKINEQDLQFIATNFLSDWHEKNLNGCLDLSDGYRVDDFVDVLKLVASLACVNGVDEYIINQSKSVNPNIFE